MALYYEAHVTVEPEFDQRLERLQICAARFGFRVADLLMQKRAEDTLERSRFDTFLSAKSDNEADLDFRMRRLINALDSEGFTVWRYKMETATVDSRVEDIYALLRTPVAKW